MSRNAFNQLENEFSTALDRKETFDAHITEVKMKTKTYLGQIDERNGCMEYTCQFLFDTKGSPDARLKRIAATWRGSKMKYDPYHGGYWFDNSLIQPGGYTLIDPVDVSSLKKYFNTL